MSKSITIQIPPFKTGTSLSFGYWIITENKSSNLLNDKEFIFVPNMPDFITSLVLQYCETDVLLTYKYQDKFYVVPHHDEDCYGTPIFKDYNIWCTVNDIHQLWNCPQNYFTSKTQAENMLNLLKEKYGTCIGLQEYQKYTYIKPFGHFN